MFTLSGSREEVPGKAVDRNGLANRPTQRLPPVIACDQWYLSIAHNVEFVPITRLTIVPNMLTIPGHDSASGRLACPLTDVCIESPDGLPEFQEAAKNTRT